MVLIPIPNHNFGNHRLARHFVDVLDINATDNWSKGLDFKLPKSYIYLLDLSCIKYCIIWAYELIRSVAKL